MNTSNPLTITIKLTEAIRMILESTPPYMQNGEPTISDSTITFLNKNLADCNDLLIKNVDRLLENICPYKEDGTTVIADCAIDLINAAKKARGRS